MVGSPAKDRLTEMIRRHNTLQSVGLFLSVVGLGAWIRGGDYADIGYLGLGMLAVGTLCRVLRK